VTCGVVRVHIAFRLFRVETMNIRFLAAGAVLALALSGCGHAGASSVPGARTGVDPATPAAGSHGAGGGTAASAQRSTMTITIAIPAKKNSAATKRTPKTVSSGTTYIDVVLQSLNGDPQPVDGPYSVLVSAWQPTSCGGGGRAHARAPQSVCFTVDVPAPVGNDVYAIAALDGGMTLLDYTENVPVTVGSSGSATLSAALDGVGSGVTGYSMLTDPSQTTSFRLQYGVDCPAYSVQYEPKAVCSFLFDVIDGSGDDMAVDGVSSGAYLANFLALTATDVTTQQPLNLGYDTLAPNASVPVQEIDFDPANPAGGLAGVVLDGGRLGRYNTVLHPDLSEIPPDATDTVEFKAVLSPATTTAFGPNVHLPATDTATFTWDLSCKNVTIGPNDPTGLAEGSTIQFCLPQESNVHVVLR
jgi:hypothetical protein